MLKAILVLIAATAAAATAHFLGASRAVVVGVTFGTLCFAYWAWDRWIPRRPLYIQTPNIGPNDPLMLQAHRRARETMGQLPQLLQDYPENTAVRFIYQTTPTYREALWAELVTLGPERAEVYLITPPAVGAEDMNRSMQINVNEINDWKVRLGDGSMLGGYTHQAFIAAFQRDLGVLHPSLREQLSRFRDRLDGRAFTGVLHLTQNDDYL